jgi:hypothetical protein
VGGPRRRGRVGGQPHATGSVVDLRASRRGEPTNKTAERASRSGVRWRKGGFGTQSEAGARLVESMLTVVTTLKQQQRHVVESLPEAGEAALRGDAAPSLLPANAQQSPAAV